jgi:hypothetical protein
VVAVGSSADNAATDLFVCIEVFYNRQRLRQLSATTERQRSAAPSSGFSRRILRPTMSPCGPLDNPYARIVQNTVHWTIRSLQ